MNPQPNPLALANPIPASAPADAAPPPRNIIPITFPAAPEAPASLDLEPSKHSNDATIQRCNGDPSTLNPQLSTNFELLIIRAIQRSGVSYRRQRLACATIPQFLPKTNHPGNDRQAREVAIACLMATGPR